MKILIVSQHYYPENFTITKIAEELFCYGHDVTVLTGKPNYGLGHILEGYEDVKYEEINGVKVHRVNLVPRKKGRFSIIRNYLSFWKNSKKWIRNTKEKFDIVYTMSLSPVTVLSAGNLYKKKHNVPHVVHCVDLWPESVLATKAVRKHSLMYLILYIWSKKLYSKVDKVLIGSPSFKEYFDNILKLKKNCVFVPQPSIIEDSKEIVPVELNEGFNIVYSGNIGILQEIEKVPEIMSYVKNENVFFHIIGMGPKSDELIENIPIYGQVRHVLFHGHMKAIEASRFIKAADAVYLSLNNTGYVGKTIPVKMMQYFSFSKPVIGVIEGDAKDIISKTRGGLLCDNDVNSIANTMDTMVGLSKSELNEMGKSNKAFFKEEFSLEKISKKIENELLQEVK